MAHDGCAGEAVYQSGSPVGLKVESGSESLGERSNAGDGSTVAGKGDRRS
jgi:hypothetical protein